MGTVKIRTLKAKECGRMAFDKNKYDQNFKKEKYDRIDILLPKGDKEKIKAYADAHGTTISQICKDALYEKIGE